MEFDRYGQYKPTGAREWLGKRDEAFSTICPFSPAACDEDVLAEERFPAAIRRDDRIGRFEAAYVGHAQEQDFRENGSSGGMVTWVACELLAGGLVDGVAHVAAQETGCGEPLFRYRISRSPDELRSGAKSRYYPVELSRVIREIRETPGRYAIIGIPCFIKAVHLACAQDAVLRQRIVFTLGLFCGHMKSARMAESFAWQMGTGLKAVSSFDYRLKNPERPANWYAAQLKLEDGSVRCRDWWNMADGDWGAGFFQNSACDFCDDVVAETADISFGDAWLEPYSSDGRGTNVVIVRSPLLLDIVRAGIAGGRIRLEEVGPDFVAATQAAGFRQRREGLAYRLTLPKRGIVPVKRVSPDAYRLPSRRKLIYRMRMRTSRWSHRVFWLARVLHWPKLYIGWASGASALYHGFAYSRGRLGRIAKRFGIGDIEWRD